MAEYDVGDLAIVTATFTPSDGETLPVSVTAQVKEPDGTTTTPTVTYDDETGIASVRVPLDTAGVWWVRFQGLTGSSAQIGAEEHMLYVVPSRF
jgi:uncharacterized protein YfaS (alpha-2-macroglobulin family)